MTSTVLPILFILMRNDLSSMNTGKAIAQGSHASNAFVHKFHSVMREQSAEPLEKYEKLHSAYYEWEHATSQGFGTVLVLEDSMVNITDTVDYAAESGFFSGIVHDPTYPVLDGSVVHHIPLDTCGFIFVPNKNESSTFLTHLKNIPLHR